MSILGVIFSINTLSAAIRMVVPIALAAVGGAFSERSGVINIGLEGMILTGAFAGTVGSYYSGSAFLGVLAALAAGVILGLLFSFFTIDLEADHVVAGVGINILSLGFTTWLMQVIWGQKGASPQVAGLPEIEIPFLAGLPLFGDLFASNSPIVYLMFIIVILSWYLLFKTPLGLRIRFTGEHPEAADTLGINIRFIKYFSVTLSSVLAALGGSYLSLGQLNWFSSNMSAGRGYMALAANIFGQWNPLGGFAASMLFAFTDAVQMRLQGMNLNIASEFIQMLPYVLTVLILAGAVIKSRPPAALGSHYKSNK